MGLENILNGFNDFKRKIFPIVFSSMMACSGGTTNPNPNPPNPPHPPVPTNHAPAITSNPITQVDEQRSYIYQCQAVDSEGDNLTYSLIENPSWLSINPQTCLITGEAPEVSQDTNSQVKIRVSDGKVFTEQPYNLNVNNLFNTYILSSDPDKLNKFVDVGVVNNSLTNIKISESDSLPRSLFNNVLPSGLSNIQAPKTKNSRVEEEAYYLRFTDPMNFATGDVISSGITSKTPYGLFMEVNSFSTDRRIFFAKTGSLEKVLKKGNISFFKSLTSADAFSFRGSEGSQNIQFVPYQSNPANFNFGISLNDFVLHDGDANPNTKNDRLIANGTVSFSSDFSISASLNDFKLEQLRFQSITNELADITIGSNFFSLAAPDKMYIGEYNISPFVIGYLPTLVPIPVVVTPTIDVFATIDLTQINPLGIRVKQQASLDAKLIYDGGWKKETSFNKDFEFSLFNLENWNAKFLFGPKLKLYFWGIAGPFGEANAKIRLESQSGNWKIYGGFETSLGVSMEMFKKQIGVYSEKVWEYEKLLAQKDDVIPPPPQEKIDTLRAGKDAFVRVIVYPDGSKTYAGFNTTELEVKNNYQGALETLIQFPVPASTIPLNSDILSAKLVLYGQGIFNIFNSTANIGAKKILGTWDEATVKYNTKPAYGETVSSIVVYDGTGIRQYEWDVTSLVKSWTSGQLANNGIAFTTNDDPDGPVRFNSREHPDASKRPMLIVTYR